MNKSGTAEGNTVVEKTYSSVVAGAKKKKKGNLIYLGPTVIGAVRHSTVFKDGILPKAAQKCVDEFPMIGQLFVEMDKMPEAVRQLSMKQSALKEICNQVSRHFAVKK